MSLSFPLRHPARARLLLVTVAWLAAALVAGCGGSSPKRPVARPSSQAVSASTVGYAAELGGLPELIAAAKREGHLTVIGLRPDWANYGQVIAAFTAKYGIVVSQQDPAASSLQEIAAARQAGRSAAAPDVFDLSPTVAAASRSMLAPYKVTTWGDIPDAIKDVGGRFAGAYGGFASIRYDARRFPRPTSAAALLGPPFGGAVSLSGDPRRTSGAFYGTMMAAMDAGGSPDDIGPGVQFFAAAKQAQTAAVNPSPAGAATTSPSAVARPPGAVIDWDYVNVPQSRAARGSARWQVVIPKAAVGQYYMQAVNVDAPHPAAARLWEEFVFSDEGQNLLLRSYARPGRADAMRAARTLDTTLWNQLPALRTTPVFLTPQQTAKAKAYLNAHWAAASP